MYQRLKRPSNVIADDDNSTTECQNPFIASPLKRTATFLRRLLGFVETCCQQRRDVIDRDPSCVCQSIVYLYQNSLKEYGWKGWELNDDVWRVELIWTLVFIDGVYAFDDYGNGPTRQESWLGGRRSVVEELRLERGDDVVELVVGTSENVLLI
jgi:hypothetical protein